MYVGVTAWAHANNIKVLIISLVFCKTLKTQVTQLPNAIIKLANYIQGKTLGHQVNSILVIKVILFAEFTSVLTKLFKFNSVLLINATHVKLTQKHSKLLASQGQV